MTALDTPSGVVSGAPTLEIGTPGYTYADLYDPLRLRDLFELFRASLHEADADVSARYEKYLSGRGTDMTPTQISDVIVDTAPHVSAFVAELFQVRDEHGRMRHAVEQENVIFLFKREFVVRRALKRYRSADGIDATAVREAVDALLTAGFGAQYSGVDPERAISGIVVSLINLERGLRAATIVDGTLADDARTTLGAIAAASAVSPSLAQRIAPTSSVDDAAASVNGLLELFDEWVAVEHYAPSDRTRGWVSLALPHTLDYARLVELDVVDAMPSGTYMGPSDTYRHRDGFSLTDPRFSHREVLDQVHYCIFCHERDKDSCSKGLREKDGSPKRNPLGIMLEGCPLDEKISEMHVLKSRGDGLAALAVITIDNPMCAGTGHRICNDCMKACIYQKQDPVNIPQAETGVLTEVLRYPFGFEIYSFLTRWNPLNVSRPYPAPYNGSKVLIVGLGPAGYTLAHYMLNEGFGVVGIDGLKIEPLPEWLVGSASSLPEPIHDWDAIYDRLDERILLGFGGVSEYGITVRWDKNFLKVIYILLARRQTFAYYGGIRFGGTITVDDAWTMGFDHVAIATGAGKPTVVPMRNNLARGVRQASDFLMALQLTGAAKSSSLANLQLRMPVVVVGGGLTAIDTATEAMAYYPILAERVLARVTTLEAELGEDAFASSLGDEDREILAEYLEHGRMIVAEREAAAREGREPDFISLLRGWGGVTLVYRKTMLDSPAYRLNHEEIIKALEEGIYFAENLSPIEVVGDRFGAAESVVFERQAIDENGKWRATGEKETIRARSIMVAAGTSPNTIIDREAPQGFEYDDWKQFFAPFVAETAHAQEQAVGAMSNGSNGSASPTVAYQSLREVLHRKAESGEVGFFTSYNREGRLISYFGDNHPKYAGNVVKAMASARDGYQRIVDLFADRIGDLDASKQSERDGEWSSFKEHLDSRLIARVHEVRRLTPTIVEVILHAPMQAERFRPGQFYRLQNFETHAREIDGTRLAMEGLALTGAWVDVERGLVSVIVLEMGASSRMCAMLREGEPVVLMGPTGAPTEIPANEDVALLGGGLGNAVLFSIGKALRANGCRVVYFAGYKRGVDLYHQSDVEESADQVIWSTDTGDVIEVRRPNDRFLAGNILEAMVAYAKGDLGEQIIPLDKVRRIIVIGSDRMMAAVQSARHGLLAQYLGEHVAVGSINSPMQCMMKEICAQCLQRHVDPVTGEELGFVFSCFNQDQHLDNVDFHFLNSRLKGNSLLEKVSHQWFERLLRIESVEQV